jgi:hypothetical protein
MVASEQLQVVRARCTCAQADGAANLGQSLQIWVPGRVIGITRPESDFFGVVEEAG